jgi:subtilase family serine protease
MSINFKRTAAQEASLQALLQAQQDRNSPSYHKWLTPAQFGQQFGMSTDDLAKVSSWLQEEGFTVVGVSQSNNSISFTGSVANVENAFQTQIHNYTSDGETHFANSTNISLPGAIAGMVSNVRGLNDFRLKSKMKPVKPRFTSGISGSHYLAPGDIAVIYDLNPLLQASTPLNGSGITIGIVGQTQIFPGDITNFRGAAGLPANAPTVVTVPGTTPITYQQGAATGDLAETDLDLEWSGGVATGASIVLITADSVNNSLQYVIQNAINGITIPIVSMSYGACEAGYSTSDRSATEALLAQANTQGQTVVLAAGDTGAADCDSAATPVTSAQYGLAVDYPGSSTYVTDAGGTEFMGDGTAQNPQTGSGTYWSANGSNDVLTSAKSYIPEMVWNDTTFAIANGGGLSAGGGGVSAVFSKPSWQTGVPNIPADGKRDVPDFSWDASADHDSYLYCTQVNTDSSPTAYVSSCQATSFRLSDPGQQDDQTFQALGGGTSFAAPQFAGLMAIVEQKLGSGALGNVNPALYAMGANPTTYASVFHDITTGNNIVPCTPGTTSCPTSGTPQFGYNAGTGYDLATGIGSIDGNNFATAFASLVAATGTKTALVASPSSGVEIGQKVTYTATVTPNTLSTAPTGTVTFYVDGAAQTPVALGTTAPYTAMDTTSFASSGNHTVYALYTSGDATYTGSTSPAIVLAVTASGSAATTTSVSASPSSFALGASVTLNAVVQGTTQGTLTGPVTFTIGSTTVGKVNQVTIGNNNQATASLTVTSAASLGFNPGTDTITASYGGDSYNAASSGTTTVTVTNPSITVSATPITISSPSPGNSGTSTITLTSTGGYAGTATVTATAASLNAQYGFGGTGTETASVLLAANGTGTTTITITTVSATGNVIKGPSGNFRAKAARVAAAGGTMAGCLLLLLIPGIRRKRWPVALGMLVFLSVGAGLGCGGGGGGASGAGTYQVTITATDSSNTNITGSGTLTVTIQ